MVFVVILIIYFSFYTVHCMAFYCLYESICAFTIFDFLNSIEILVNLEVAAISNKNIYQVQCLLDCKRNTRAIRYSGDGSRRKCHHECGEFKVNDSFSRLFLFLIYFLNHCCYILVMDLLY